MVERGPDVGPPVAIVDVQRAQLPVLLRIPDVHEIGLGNCRQQTAIAAPGDAAHNWIALGFLFQDGHFPQRRGVPDAHGTVPGGRGHLLAVGAEAGIVDVTGVAAHAAAGFGFLQVPEANGAVGGSRRKRVAVRAEREKVNSARVAVQHRHRIAARRIP